MKVVKNELVNPRVLGKGTLHKVLSYDDNIMVCELTMEEGASGKEHSHPHTQITYIVSGEHAFTVGNETMILRSGDSVYIPSDTLHNSTCLKAGKIIDVFTPKRDDFLQS
ncbi:MAG: cupin domain-containing protein [Eubacteriales bacterium]|nr:cupin domain-containing protein [Eubacteriales bacterium]